MYPQKSRVEILIPNVMKLEEGAFGMSLDHYRGALMKGISALAEENPLSSPTPSAICRQNEKRPSYEPGSGSSPDTASALILNLLETSRAFPFWLFNLKL